MITLWSEYAISYASLCNDTEIFEQPMEFLKVWEANEPLLKFVLSLYKWISLCLATPWQLKVPKLICTPSHFDAMNAKNLEAVCKAYNDTSRQPRVQKSWYLLETWLTKLQKLKLGIP